MADVDLNLVLERLNIVIREQTEARAQNRETGAAFLTIVNKLDRLTDEVAELRGEIITFKVQLRVIVERFEAAP